MPAPAPPALLIDFDALLAQVAELRDRCRFTTPAVDCYVRGCRTEPYLGCRSRRHGLVLTCKDHDPHRWDDGADLDPYAWITQGARTAQEARAQAEASQDQDAPNPPQTDAERALLLLQALIQLARGTDQDGGGGGGTREPRRPVPPTLPSGGRHADDIF